MRARKTHTARQARFVAEYLGDLNAKQAAIRAGYSQRTAGEIGRELLEKTWVRQAVAQGLAVQLARAELTATRTLEEVRRIAFSDPGRVFDRQGNVLPLGDLPPDVRAGIASYDVVRRNVAARDGRTEEVIRIRFHDKLRALEMAMKRFGLLVDKVEAFGALEITWRATETEAART